MLKVDTRTPWEQAAGRQLLRLALAVTATAPPADRAALLAGLPPRKRALVEHASDRQALGWLSDGEVDAIILEDEPA